MAAAVARREWRRKMMTVRNSLFGVAALLLVSACGGGPTGTSESVTVDDGSEIQDSSPLTAVFERASEKWNIPADLLKAVAFNQTQLDPAIGEVEFDGQAAAYGYFGLAGAELDRAAQLS